VTAARTPLGPSKWVVAALVSVGIFVALLDTTIVDIVLPHMMSSLDADIYGVQWVVIIYFLGSAISMTAAGWLAETLGHRDAFLLGTVLFIGMSALAGGAPSLEVMLAARLFQGMGEGLMIPVGLVILYEAFPPEEHGLAMGLYGLSASFAPAVGPTLGGLITEHLEWRWVFYINLPIGIVTIFLVWTLLANPRSGSGRRLDAVGFALLATAFSALIVFTGKGQEKGWLDSDFILWMLLLTVAAGAAAAAWLALAPRPLFPRRVTGHRPFRLGLLAMVLLSVTAYGFFLLLPVYLQRVHGYTTLQAGLIMLPGALLSGLVTALSGALADRVSPRWIAVTFLLATAAACWNFHTDPDTPRWLLTVDNMLFGAAVGGVFAPVTLIALGTLEERDLSDGSTLLNVVRLVAGSLGTAHATAMMTGRTGAFYEGLAANLAQGSARAAELAARLGEAAGLAADRAFDPDAWHLLLATGQGLMLRMAASYAYQATFRHLGLFSVAAAAVVLLVRGRLRRHAGPVH